MSHLTFRLATIEDAPQIQPLVQSAYRGESSRQGWTTEADLLSGTRITVRGIEEKITTPKSVVILGFATSSEQPQSTLVACCELLLRSNSIAYFGMFAVSPLLQGGGLGRQVLAYAEEYCKNELDVKVLELSVIWRRKELIEWYVRRGFVRSGRTFPFPYEQLAEDARALNEDLHFEVLEKRLV